MRFLQVSLCRYCAKQHADSAGLFRQALEVVRSARAMQSVPARCTRRMCRSARSWVGRAVSADGTIQRWQHPNLHVGTVAAQPPRAAAARRSGQPDKAVAEIAERAGAAEENNRGESEIHWIQVGIVIKIGMIIAS